MAQQIEVILHKIARRWKITMCDSAQYAPQSIIFSKHMIEMTPFHPLTKYISNIALRTRRKMCTYCTSSYNSVF